MVAKIAKECEPLNILHHGVELVPVKDKNSATVRRHVDGMFLNRDRAISAEMSGEKLVVVSRDVDHPGAFARFPQNLLDNVVVFLRPIDAATQRPDIDEIADDVERLKLVLAQELEKSPGVAPSRAKVQVRDPGCAILDSREGTRRDFSRRA